MFHVKHFSILPAQDGTFYGTDNTYSNLIHFDQSGNTIWSVPGDYPQIATTDGGVIGSSGITYDSNGNATGQIANMPTQSWLGYAYQNDPGQAQQVAFPATAVASAFNFWFWGGSTTFTKLPKFAQLVSCKDNTTANPLSCPQPKDAAFHAWWYLKQRMTDSPTRIWDLTYLVFNGTWKPGEFLNYLNLGAGPEFYDGEKSTVTLSDAQCGGAAGRTVQTQFQMDNGGPTCDMAAMSCRLGSSQPLRTFFEPRAISFDNQGVTDGNIAMEFHEALHGFTGMDDWQLQGFLGCTQTNPLTGSTYNITKYLQQFVGQSPPQPQQGLPNYGIPPCKQLENNLPTNLCVR